MHTVLRHPIWRDEYYNSRNRDTRPLSNSAAETGNGWKRNRVEMTREVLNRETSRNNRRCGFATVLAPVNYIRQQFRHPSSSIRDLSLAKDSKLPRLIRPSLSFSFESIFSRVRLSGNFERNETIERSALNKAGKTCRFIRVVKN